MAVLAALFSDYEFRNRVSQSLHNRVVRATFSHVRIIDMEEQDRTVQQQT
jgi:hypothetical protein